MQQLRFDLPRLTGHLQFAFEVNKATVHPVERSGGLAATDMCPCQQQVTYWTASMDSAFLWPSPPVLLAAGSIMLSTCMSVCACMRCPAEAFTDRLAVDL